MANYKATLVSSVVAQTCDIILAAIHDNHRQVESS
jgi:hypothetical protein